MILNWSPYKYGHLNSSLGLGGAFLWRSFGEAGVVVVVPSTVIIHEYFKTIFSDEFATATLDVTLLESFVSDDIVVPKDKKSFTVSASTGYVEATLFPSPENVLYLFELVYTDSSGISRVVPFVPVRVTTDARLTDITSVDN